jgi:Holliday junction resolvasome RuvABC endonuclease subunit
MQEKPLRILALDVGFTHTGMAVLTFENPDWVISHTACAVTSPEAKKRRIYETDDKIRRVKIICNALSAEIEEWSPELIAAEMPSSGGKSARAHASMGISIAVVTCISELTQVPLRSYTWDDIKIKVTGSKTAGKAAIQARITTLWPQLGAQYASKKSQTGYTGDFEHIADAIGAGMCALTSDVVAALVGRYLRSTP